MSAAGNSMQPDLLARLVERTSGREPVVLPRPASVFETRAPGDGRLGTGRLLDEVQWLDGSGAPDEQARVESESARAIADEMPPAKWRRPRNSDDEADRQAEQGGLRANSGRDDVDVPAHAEIRAHATPGTRGDEMPAIDAPRRSARALPARSDLYDELEAAHAASSDAGHPTVRAGQLSRARRAQPHAADDLDSPATREQDDAEPTRTGTLNSERPSPSWLAPQADPALTAIHRDAHRNQDRDVTAAQAAPVINVTIGRVEIRAVSSAAKSARGSDARDLPKRMSLDEYLARRSTER